jgi:hypothetical protein
MMNAAGRPKSKRMAQAQNSQSAEPSPYAPSASSSHYSQPLLYNYTATTEEPLTDDEEEVSGTVSATLNYRRNSGAPISINLIVRGDDQGFLTEPTLARIQSGLYHVVNSYGIFSEKVYALRNRMENEIQGLDISLWGDQRSKASAVATEVTYLLLIR